MQSIITAYWKTIENHYSFIILVVAANPLGSSPLKLDHEVKTIKEALKRFRKRDNFVVEYCLAATPSELRRALLDLAPHILHFSGHGSGEQRLLFVSDLLRIGWVVKSFSNSSSISLRIFKY